MTVLACTAHLHLKQSLGQRPHRYVNIDIYESICVPMFPCVCMVEKQSYLATLACAWVLVVGYPRDFVEYKLGYPGELQSIAVYRLWATPGNWSNISRGRGMAACIHYLQPSSSLSSTYSL